MPSERVRRALSVVVLLSGLGCPEPRPPARFDAASTPLLARVPEAASGVLVLRQLEGADARGTAVVALGPHPDRRTSWMRDVEGGTVAVTRGSGPRPILVATDLPTRDAARVAAQLEPIGTALELAPVADGPLGLVSAGWAPQVGVARPPAAILEALQRAPSNAAVIAAYVSSRDVEAWPIPVTVGWLIVDGDRVTIDGELELRGALPASVALDAVSTQWSTLVSAISPPCRAALEHVASRLRIARRGRRTGFHASLPRVDLAALGVCTENPSAALAAEIR